MKKSKLIPSILSITLICAMLLTVAPVPAKAAAVHVTDEASLTAALAAQEPLIELDNDITITGSLYLAANAKLVGSGTTKLSGDWSFTLINAGDFDLELEGVWLTGGSTAIYAGSGAVTLTNCKFTANAGTNGAVLLSSCGNVTASGCQIGDLTGGGNGTGSTGAFSLYGTGSASFTNCTFEGNWGTSEGGGAIYASGISSVTCSGCTFDKNTYGAPQPTTEGGAIRTIGVSTLSCTNCTFNLNYAQNGAAVSTNAATTSFNGCTFTENIAAGSGGAIYIPSGNLTMTNCTLTGNQCAASGGAVFNGTGTATFSNCTVSNNAATVYNGGAVYSWGGPVNVNGGTWSGNQAMHATNGAGGAIYADNAATVTISNATFSGNSAGVCGGAVFAKDGGVTLTNDTFKNNSTPGAVGGAILTANSDVTGTNCIFTGNSSAAPGGSDIYADGAGAISMTGGSFNPNTSWTSGGAKMMANSIPNATEVNSYSGLTTAVKQGVKAIKITKDIEITDTISIKQATTIVADEGVTISGAGVYTIFNVAKNATLNVENLTMEKAYTAIYSPGGTVNAVNCVFKDNVGATGGGILNAGPTTVTGCTFENNKTTDLGGAICANGAAPLTVTDCKFINNYAPNTAGAIYTMADETVITGSLFEGNSAEGYFAGALYAQGGTTKVENTTFLNNSVTGEEASGGAIYVNEGASVSVVNCTLEGNKAGKNGGAVFTNEAAKALDITGSYFTGNEAPCNGGAVYTLVGGTYEGNTFSKNKAGESGGALFAGFGTVTLKDDTFDGNAATAYNGGAVFNFGADLVIDGGTYKNNTAANGGAVYINGDAAGFAPKNASFTGNKASAAGGAIYSMIGATYEGNSFTKNTAAESGGALFLGYGSVTLKRNNFVENTATQWNGGAVFSYEAPLTVEGAFFQSNKANMGGGIFVNGASPLTATGATFMYNTSGSGGGIFGIDGPIMLTSCIFYANRATGSVGGAIYEDTNLLKAENCIFGANKAKAPAAKAIFNRLGNIELTNGNLPGASSWADKGRIIKSNTMSYEVSGTNCTRAQAATFLWLVSGNQSGSASNPFKDITKSNNAYKAVMWAYDKGITTGTTAKTFAPRTTVTRAQFVTFLWRAAGCPAAENVIDKFTDVAAGEYYADAVNWAVEKGITYGTSDTTFSPANTCTIEHVMLFLSRYIAQ